MQCAKSYGIPLHLHLKLSIVADYADDGMDGGTLQQIWNTLQEEMLIADVYGVEFNFKKMKLYLMEGEAFQATPEEVNLIQCFRRQGITVDTSLDITFLKVPLIGSHVFLQEWVASKLEKLSKTLDIVAKLPNPHVAFYLLRQAAGVCTLMYSNGEGFV